MERGKRICMTLKELRKRIADANEIPYEIEECPHKGDCPGTCPKCEAEVRYLMEAIDKREQQGKPVVIEGLMDEKELRQAFAIEPIDNKDEEIVLAGLPVPEEPEVLMGDVQLMGNMRWPSSNDFAFTIAKELLAKSGGNFVFSPAGLCCILEMLRDGMDESSDIYEKVGELTMEAYSSIEPQAKNDFQLEHAASIWYNQKLGVIKEDYLETIEDGYDAEGHHADFSQKAKTKLWMDKWVSDKTHQMIKKLDTELSGEALLVLLDAIYMKGKWTSPFDPDLTDMGTFHNADGTESDVDMMYQEIEEALYGETEEYQVIRLPYKDSEYSMVVVLPKENCCIESVMANARWLDFSEEETDVQLYMPRFDFDNTLSFVKILTKLGLKDMFETEDSFPKITDLPAHISQIKQQCVIKVAEEGTEAAAVTMAECEVGCCPPDEIPEPITMILDRPFGFAIKDDFGLPLFMGVIKSMNNNI
jgi:serpin B